MTDSRETVNSRRKALITGAAVIPHRRLLRPEVNNSRLTSTNLCVRSVYEQKKEKQTMSSGKTKKNPEPTKLKKNKS